VNPLDVAEFDDDYVVRRGLIFRFGDYSDKAFSLTPAEYLAAHADFAPVPIDLSHTGTVLDGKMGELIEAEVRGDELHGTVRLRKWLDDVLTEADRKVSCEWDRATKRLNKLSLVPTPRVSDAALFASFAAVHPEGDDLAGFTARKRDEDLTRSMQSVHDHIAMNHPWACGPAMMSAESAGFGDKPKQFKAIRKLHQDTVEHGATCPGKPGTGQASMSDDPATTPAERPIVMLKDSLIQAVGLLPDAPTDDDLKKFAAAIPAEYRGKVATFAAEAKPADRFAKFADDPEFIAFKAEQDRQLQAERDRIARLEADREADRKTAAFSAAKVDAGRLCTRIGVGGDIESNVASLLLSLGEMDRAHAPKVTFSAAGTLREDGSLADAFRAILGDLPARNVLPIDPDGKLDAARVKALFNGHQAKADPEAVSDEAHRRNLSYTEIGRQILAAQDARKGA
jgi:hypothetical protein